MVVGAVEIEPALDAVGVLRAYVDAYPGVSDEDWAPWASLWRAAGA